VRLHKILSPISAPVVIFYRKTFKNCTYFHIFASANKNVPVSEAYARLESMDDTRWEFYANIFLVNNTSGKDLKVGAHVQREAPGKIFVLPSTFSL